MVFDFTEWAPVRCDRISDQSRQMNENENCTYQYCHIFRACTGKLHTANVRTTIISIRITPRRARSTLFVEFDTWYVCAPCWLWQCRWWKLCVRHVVVTILSESTETWQFPHEKTIGMFEMKMTKRIKKTWQIYWTMAKWNIWIYGDLAENLCAALRLK